MRAKHFAHRSPWLSLTAAALNAFALFTLSCLAFPDQSNAALPVPVACQNDVHGANDDPGQRDTTRVCTEAGNGAPYELHVSANWDETTLNGNNTADICTLYDTDANTLADLTICVTLESSGPMNGNLAEFQQFRLYTCNDTRADRCAGPTEITGTFTTSCEAAQKDTDPFGPMVVNGPGDEYPTDTETLCWIDLDDFGAVGANAELLDACAYPSEEPNSAPSDCIIFSVCSVAGDCDDDNVCTTDVCAPGGICGHIPNPGTPCDKLFCDGDDICNASGLCEENVVPRDCDDGVSCTMNACDELTRQCINTPRNSLCDDGTFCNGVEICDQTNDCQAGAPQDCDDGIACTVDACNEGAASCDNTPNDAACDDGAYCNGDETCSALTGCEAGTSVDCDDAVSCTTDTCDEGTDSCTSTTDDTACDDDEFCNGAETCDATNDCQAGSAPNCNDAVGCTVDSCNEVTDRCNNIADNSACTDGAYCNGVEICDITSDCQSGLAPDCDDGVLCTADSCNEAGDTCDNIPDNTACSDGMFCTGVETCDAIGGCQTGSDPCPGAFCNESGDVCAGCLVDADCDNSVFCDGAETCTAGTCTAGTPPNCNDGVLCTADSCNEAGDTCDNIPDNTACSDGMFCTGAETCDAIGGCQTGSDPCPGAFCNESGDVCAGCLVDADCDNSVFCDGAETCTAGTCTAGTPPNCSDGVACTVDSCNEAGNTCDNDANNALCDNGQFCDGAETCDAINDCQAGSAPDCNDGVLCTADSCNEAGDTCDNIPDNTACSDGMFCTGVETCDAIGGCQTGSDPCPGAFCNESGDVCAGCLVDADCDNSVFCDGAETCTAGTCTAGTPPNCSDGVACTVDSCNEAGNTCDNDANNALCDNGQFCDGAETCDAINDCQAGSAPDCNDGVLCTADSCNEAGDTCDNIPDNTACSDGMFCTGVETCDAIGGCQTGSDPCPGAFCNESGDVCAGCLVDADCDNSVFCDGAETCTAGTCTAGTPPNCNDGVACTVDSCNEAGNTCDNDANNALCDNGQFCDGAETCDAINDCQAGSAPDCNDGVLCTADSCNEAGDTCDNIPDNTACSDGMFCTGVETCDAIGGCQTGSDPCPGAFCNESGDVCAGCLVDADCDNGVFCDGAETCTAGTCTGSTPPNCNDGVACTVDSCNEAGNTCDNDANNALCDNGQFCDGAETCDAINDCQAGSAPDCNDGVLCTADSCNEAGDTCDNIPDNTTCSDGMFCTGIETCDATGGCQTGFDPCPGAFCNESGDVCAGCLVDADCDNSVFCDGAETCTAGTCTAGTPPNCNDGVACTVDSCNEAGNTCDNDANNALCDNGQFCDGTETCDAIGGCQTGSDPCPGAFCNESGDVCAGCLVDADCDNGVFCDGAETCTAGTCTGSTPPNCNDGVACTVDSCNEAGNTCDNDANNALCDNGQFCDGAETCDAINDCQTGTPLACDDGVSCTDDTCDEVGDTCSNISLDAICDNGLFCDGAELCDVTNDCQNGTPLVCDDGVFCTLDSCSEATQECESTANDALCDDGLPCNGDETCDAINDCQTGIPIECFDGFICSTDTCNPSTGLCESDFSTCICGDGEITGIENCEPPETAGTFEDCNNLVDDDGDAKIDCRDEDCAPGARGEVCDEHCTLDSVCAKFQKDPALIRYFHRSGYDVFKLHARFLIEEGFFNPAAEVIEFEVANDQGAFYRAIVAPGVLDPNRNGKRYKFKDKTASLLGPSSPVDGIAKLSFIIRDFEGVPHATFRIQAYGNFSAATKVTMTTQISVGATTASLTADWTPKRKKWKLNLTDF